MGNDRVGLCRKIRRRAGDVGGAQVSQGSCWNLNNLESGTDSGNTP